MNFKAFINESTITNVEQLLDLETPPGIVADWLEDAGFNDANILNLLRTNVTRSDLRIEAQSASLREEIPSIIITDITPCWLAWEFNAHEGNGWESFEIVSHPEWQARGQDKSIIEKFRIRFYDSMHGSMTRAVTLSELLKAFGRERFDQNKIFNCCLLLWGIERYAL